MTPPFDSATPQPAASDRPPVIAGQPGSPPLPGYRIIPTQFVNDRQLVLDDSTQYREDNNLVALYDRAARSTGRVTAWHAPTPGTGGTELQPAFGTGFVIMMDGTMVTDCHVIEGARNLQVDLNGQTYNARVIGQDPSRDLAFLRLENPRGEIFTPLPLTHTTLQPNERFYAFGFPRGAPRLFVSEGVYRGRTQLWAIANRLDGGVRAGEDPNRTFVSSQIRLDRGNSGGAVLNERGEVVAVVDISNTLNAAELTPAEDVLNSLNRAMQLTARSMTSTDSLMLGNQPLYPTQPYSGRYPAVPSYAFQPRYQPERQPGYQFSPPYQPQPGLQQPGFPLPQRQPGIQSDFQLPVNPDQFFDPLAAMPAQASRSPFQPAVVAQPALPPFQPAVVAQPALPSFQPPMVAQPAFQPQPLARPDTGQPRPFSRRLDSLLHGR